MRTRLLDLSMPACRMILPGLGLFLAALLTVGCGAESAPKYVVKGRVTRGGVPMEVRPMVGGLRVMFLRQDVAGPVDPKFAAVRSDGSFEMRGGSDGTGIAAGRYKICVTWQDDYPGGPDKLDNQFDKDNSRIYRNIPDDGDIIIDVSRPEG
jgi:hypothetical protein